MPGRTYAAVELDRTTLRFAEVDPERHTLLRLGRITLDFDVRTALAQAGEEREALGEALAAAFDGATPGRFTVALHPAGLTVWNAPLDRSTDTDARRDRLRREATLLTGIAEADLALHVTPLYADEDAEWQLVMALPAPWAEAIRGFEQSVPAGEVRLLPAAQGAAQTLAGSPGTVLTVGLHEDVTEVALVAEGSVRLVGHAPAGDSADAAFTTLSLLTRCGLLDGTGAGLESLALYGPGATSEAAAAFEGALGAPALPLDPFALLQGGNGLPEGADLFAPVIGAALR